MSFSLGKSYHINNASLFLNVNDDPSFSFSLTLIFVAFEKSNRSLPGPENSFFPIIILTSVSMFLPISALDTTVSPFCMIL
jgi:hypothetical protein